MDVDRFIADLTDVLFLDSEELTDDADLLNLGLTSMSVATLIDRWRRAGVTVDFSTLAQDTTVRHWRERVVDS